MLWRFPEKKGEGLAFLEIHIRLIKMKTKTPKHGGAREGSGRKALPDGEAMVPVTISMRLAQKDKLQKLGGAPWVRDRIDKARLPKE